MALAMKMVVSGAHHVGFPKTPPGTRNCCVARQRYKNKNMHKVMKPQGMKSVKKRRYTRRSVPRAPYNDSSFLMRVRKAGGLESQIVALTPFSFMSTPKDSSYKLDTYEEDYGYGSMTGLIRLRSDEDDGGSTVEDGELPSELPADSMKQLEQRLDRFEMTRPRESDVMAELQAARQECRIKCLEDENLVLKDRLFLMQQELNELRQRVQGGQLTCNVNVCDDSQSCLGV